MSSEAIDAGVVRERLREIVDPCSIATGVPIDIVDMGLVKEIDVNDADVSVTLRLTSPVCFQADKILAGIEQVVGRLDGVRSLHTEVDPTPFAWSSEMMAPRVRRRLRELRPTEAPRG